MEIIDQLNAAKKHIELLDTRLDELRLWTAMYRLYPAEIHERMFNRIAELTVEKNNALLDMDGVDDRRDDSGKDEYDKD